MPNSPSDNHTSTNGTPIGAKLVSEEDIDVSQEDDEEDEEEEHSEEQEEDSFRRRLAGWVIGVLGIGVPMLFVFFLIWRHTMSTAAVFTEPKQLITTVAFSPNGNWLAAAGMDQTIYLWNVKTRKLQTTIPGHTQTINSLAFSPDGKKLLAGDLFTVRLWNLDDRKELLRWDLQKNFILHVAFSPNGRYVATTSRADVDIRLWDIEKRGQEAFAASVVGLTGTPTGMGPLVAAASMHPERVSFARLVRKFKGHTEMGVKCVVFFGDGKRMLTAGGKTVRLWQVDTGKLLHTFPINDRGVNWVALSPDEKHFACAGNDRMIHIWNLAEKKRVQRLEGHKSPVKTVDYSPDGRYLVSGGLAMPRSKVEQHSAMPTEKRALRIWSLATGLESSYIEDYTTAVWSARFSPDGYYIASGGADAKVRLWRVP